MADRHAFRANWHDYNDGIYFITICSAEKAYLFGHIHNVEMRLGELGQIIEESILDLRNHHNVEVWNYVVMPNHIHMVISVGTRSAASESGDNIGTVVNMGCLKPPMHGEKCNDFHHNSQLAVIIGSFKSAVTRKYRLLMQTRQDMQTRTRQTASLPAQIWQKRYHEHIIRNQRAFDNIMNYIDNNILNWNNDCFYDK